VIVGCDPRFVGNLLVTRLSMIFTIPVAADLMKGRGFDTSQRTSPYQDFRSLTKIGFFATECANVDARYDIVQFFRDNDTQSVVEMDFYLALKVVNKIVYFAMALRDGVGKMDCRLLTWRVP
jgi:hypothetical protein